MTPALEEAFHRSRSTTSPQTKVGNIARLLLEALVEQLRTHRLRMQERPAQPRHGSSHDQQRNPDRRYGNTSRGRHRRRANDAEELTTDPQHVENDQAAQYTMSGGAGEPDAGPNHRRRHRRRHRSHPLGSPPIYKPKLGPTLGWSHHLKDCIVYEVAARKQEARHQQRRERRSDHNNAERTGSQSQTSDSHEESEPIDDLNAFHHVAKAQSSHGRGQGAGEPFPPQTPVYEHTPYSDTVEALERRQAEEPHSSG